MKRLFSLILALVLILAMSPAVRADIIYIPQDRFLENHMDDCARVDRNYTAIVEVKLYRSPENDHVERAIPQGDTLHIYYTYTDARDILWGYTESYDPEFTGWVPMAYLELVYDYISFEEDHGDQIVYLDDFLKLDDALAGQSIRFWDYPGSEGGTDMTVSNDAENLPYYFATYLDSEGRSWGYVNYYWGYKNFWICLSDPTASVNTIYPDGAPEVEITQPQPLLPEQEITPQKNPVPMMIAGGAVVCVIATAVVLLKKKKG